MSYQMEIEHTPAKIMKLDEEEQHEEKMEQEIAMKHEIAMEQEIAVSTANLPPEDFISWINDVPEDSKKTYGRTSVGQWFCLVLITWAKDKNYETRLYMDEDHRDKGPWYPWYQLWEENRYIEKATWTNYVKAKTHIMSREHQLQKDLRREKVHMRIRRMPKDCAEHPHKYLKLGDHIQSTLVDGWIHHEGIYAGDDNVIHVSPHCSGISEAWSQKVNSCTRTGKVYPNFADTPTSEIRVVVYRMRLRKREDIVDSASYYAEQCFLDGDYNLILKNCQHFASFCACGEEHMTDAPQLLVTGGIVAGIVGLIGFAAWFGKESAREQVRREHDRAIEEKQHADGKIPERS